MSELAAEVPAYAWMQAARRLRRPRIKLAPMLGASIVLLLLVCAFVPQWIAPYDPLKFDYRATLLAPSWAHPFGTDNFGRDILSRVIWATRIDMQIALFAHAVPRDIRHPRRLPGRLFRRPGRCAVPPAGEPDRHHARSWCW